MGLFGLDCGQGSLTKKDPMALRELLLKTLDEVERLLDEPFEDEIPCAGHESTTDSLRRPENTWKPDQ
jgi:hypothetical protein